MPRTSLAWKFKSPRKWANASFADSNKQGYQISLALNCFYSFQKGSINLALTKRGKCCLVLSLVCGLNQTSLYCHFSQESSVANRAEYRSCLSRGFNFKLGRFATSRVESSTQILFLLVGTILWLLVGQCYHFQSLKTRLYHIWHVV